MFFPVKGPSVVAAGGSLFPHKRLDRKWSTKCARDCSESSISQKRVKKTQVSEHSWQFIPFNSFISIMSIHSCQFVHVNSFMSIHSFHFSHVNSFVSLLSCQVIHVKSLMSMHSFQVAYVNSFISSHSWQSISSHSF